MELLVLRYVVTVSNNIWLLYNCYELRIVTSATTHVYFTVTVPTRPPIGPIGPVGPPGPPGSPRPTRRSLQEDEVQQLASVDDNDATNELMDDYSVPNPFDFDGHLSAITTHRNKRQANNKKRYVLFSYTRLLRKYWESTIHFDERGTLSELLPLFCGNVLFGVIS